MKAQAWIFSVRHCPKNAAGVDMPPALHRAAVVGPAGASTAEAAFHTAAVPEAMRAEIRGDRVVRDFVDGKLDPNESGYYTYSYSPLGTWTVCIGSVHEVLNPHCPVCDGPHDDAKHRQQRAAGR